MDTHLPPESSPSMDTHLPPESSPSMDTHLPPESSLSTDVHLQQESSLSTDVHLPQESSLSTDVHLPQESSLSTDVYLPQESSLSPDVHLPQESSLSPDVHLPQESSPSMDTHLPPESSPSMDTLLPPVSALLRNTNLEQEPFLFVQTNLLEESPLKDTQLMEEPFTGNIQLLQQVRFSTDTHLQQQNLVTNDKVETHQTHGETSPVSVVTENNMRQPFASEVPCPKSIVGKRSTRKVPKTSNHVGKVALKKPRTLSSTQRKQKGTAGINSTNNNIGQISGEPQQHSLTLSDFVQSEREIEVLKMTGNTLFSYMVQKQVLSSKYNKTIKQLRQFLEDDVRNSVRQQSNIHYMEILDENADSHETISTSPRF